MATLTPCSQVLFTVGPFRSWVPTSPLRTLEETGLKFVVTRMEHRPAAGEVCLVGGVPEGVLVTGMTARGVHGEVASFAAPVVEIEQFARAPKGEGTHLTFTYESASQRDAWMALPWAGAELTLDL